MGHHQLDNLDELILKLIASNARIPFLEVARACGVSGAAIHQRIQKLTNLGILKGSEFVIDPESIGYETCAYMGLYLKHPEEFESVFEGLKQIPEVVECHYTTGQYDMFIKVYARNNHHLLSIFMISCNRWDCLVLKQLFLFMKHFVVRCLFLMWHPTLNKLII